jgi:hypothetical protein
MKPELAKMLREAANVIARVAAQMDRAEEPCQHCGTKRKLNWDEYQTGVELDAVVAKLRRFAKGEGPRKENHNG